MKKTFFLIILLFVVSSIFAQEDLFEGYADFKWGATVLEVKAKFPSMSDETTAEDKKAEKSVYVYEAGNFTRVFRFYKDKLYWGRTIYEEPEDATASAIVRKMLSSYGHCDVTDEYTQDMYEGTTYNWTKTATFWVELDLRDYYNSYGRISSSTILITYYNPLTSFIIQDNLTNKLMDEIEL